MAMRIDTPTFQQADAPPADDDLILPPPPPPPPPRPMDSFDPNEPRTEGLPPGGSIEHGDTDNMPIYHPPPDYGDMPVLQPPGDPLPPLPQPTVTPLTPQQYTDVTGLTLPVKGDVNGDGHLSRAEDEFLNGQPDPFEVRDSSY